MCPEQSSKNRGEYHQVLTYHACKKESSLVAYQALLYFQGCPFGVQVST